MFNKYEKQIELLKKQYSKAEKNLAATIKQSENKSKYRRTTIFLSNSIMIYFISSPARNNLSLFVNIFSIQFSIVFLSE